MHLLVFRHAKAEPLGPGGGRDADRPLSREGSRDFRRAAAIWARLAPSPACLISSPFLRAVQTAKILGESFGFEGGIETHEGLLPGADPALLAQSLPEAGVLLLVGHMPFVGDFTGPLLAGMGGASLGFKAGQGVWLELEGGLHRGQARLIASLAPDAAGRLEG